MSTPPPPTPPVPATAISRFNRDTFQLTGLVIGEKHVPSPFDVNTRYDERAFWYVVIDLKDLSVLASVASTDETTVPSQIQGYAGNSQYFMFVISNVSGGANLPQGALYEFLVKTGAGPAFNELEQMVSQLGTGTIVDFSYILATSMAQNNQPGFESYSITDLTVLTMQFLPVYADGTWIYAPIQAAVSADGPS